MKSGCSGLLPRVTDAENDCVVSSAQTGSHETLQCHVTRPLDWRAGATHEEWMKWPPRSPDHTQCDVFLWGNAKEHVFVPPLPLDIDELKLRITSAIEVIDTNIL
jgi:hypothetical protein